MNYNAYINSEKWKLRRLRALKLAGHRCQKCESKMRLHVHHLTYIRLGDELDEDLQVLCECCHRDVHGMKQLNHNKRKPKRRKRSRGPQLVGRDWVNMRRAQKANAQAQIKNIRFGADEQLSDGNGNWAHLKQV